MNKKKYTVAVVTTSRADYSHLYWPIRDLLAHPDVDLKLIVYAAHLAPQFGRTVDEIERDGFPIAHRIECLVSSDTDVGMAKTLGLAILGLADALASMRPDLLLIIADRYEMLAPATVALTLRIPIAHIEGGEISEGAIDDAVRNAITKMAHLHFTSTETARRRVIAMGEEPWRVHRAGAPSLDHLRRSTLLSREELQKTLDISLPAVAHPLAAFSGTPQPRVAAQPGFAYEPAGLAPRGPAPILVAYHPVTLLRDTTAEADALFAALEQVAGQSPGQLPLPADRRSDQAAGSAQPGSSEPATTLPGAPASPVPAAILFCFPNADAGSHALIERTRDFCRRHANARLFVNLPAVTYWSLLAQAQMLVGNSSSGIMEAASFAVPVVNVGLRQHGRERAANVLDAGANTADILARIAEAVSPAFRASLQGMQNPYGDSHAAERIVSVLLNTLNTVPPESLLRKRAQP